MTCKWDDTKNAYVLGEHTDDPELKAVLVYDMTDAEDYCDAMDMLYVCNGYNIDLVLDRVDESMIEAVRSYIAEHARLRAAAREGK